MGEAGGGLLVNLPYEPCMEVPVKTRRPPSLPLICGVFADHSSFSVLRETRMASSCEYFKKPDGYETGVMTIAPTGQAFAVSLQQPRSSTSACNA